jgi:hypothetical protein
MIWSSGIQPQIKQTFDIKDSQLSSQCVPARLADCFGLFDYLVGMEVRSE